MICIDKIRIGIDYQAQIDSSILEQKPFNNDDNNDDDCITFIEWNGVETKK